MMRILYVLSTLLNKLGKSDKMRGMSSSALEDIIFQMKLENAFE